jgi:hypothetical protein
MSKSLRITFGALLLVALIQPAFAQVSSSTQISNSVFDSLDQALRVNAVATGGGGSSSNFPNLDQLFNSVYDSTHNAFKVNIVSGLPCSTDANGAVTCMATGTSQNLTLTPSGPSGSVVVNPPGGGVGGAALSGSNGWLVTPGLRPATDNGAGFGANALRYGTGYVYMLAEGVQTVAYSATPTFDPFAGAVIEMTLTGNVTSFSFVAANLAPGETIEFIWTQDSAGGHTISGQPTNMYGFTSPGTTAGTKSIQSCTYDGTNWICGVANINLTHP